MRCDNSKKKIIELSRIKRPFFPDSKFEFDIVTSHSICNNLIIFMPGIFYTRCATIITQSKNDIKLSCIKHLYFSFLAKAQSWNLTF